MANALVLTASSLGRTSQLSGAGAVISVDGENPVTIDAWPQPSRWVPQEVRLLRDEHEVRSAPAGDELRWVLEGDERFGVFRVIARAGGTLVESHPMVVQPASSTYVLTASSPAEAPGRFVRPSRAAGTATAARPSTATPTPTIAPPGTPTPRLAPPATPTPSVAPAASNSGVTPSDTATPSVTRPVAGSTSLAAVRAPDAAPTDANAPDSPATDAAPAPTAPVPTTSPEASPAATPPGASPTADGAAPASSPSRGSAPAFTGTPAVAAGARPAAPADPEPADGPRETALAGPTSTAAKPSPADAPPEPANAGPRPAGARTKAARTPGVPAHASAEDIAAMVEVPHGEYDGRFTAWVAAAFALLTLAVVGFAGTRLIGDPDLFASATPDAAAVESGGSAPFVRPSNTADRIGLGASTMVLTLGAVVLLAGAALAALEVRGRQRRQAGTSTVARGSAATLRQVAVIVDRMSQPRAVIAVLVAGGVLLLVGFFGQLHWGARL